MIEYTESTLNLYRQGKYLEYGLARIKEISVGKEKPAFERAVVVCTEGLRWHVKPYSNPYYDLIVGQHKHGADEDVIVCERIVNGETLYVEWPVRGHNKESEDWMTNHFPVIIKMITEEMSVNGIELHEGL